MPTGAGKTLVFIHITKNYIEKRPGKRVCIILNKVLLLEQTKQRVAEVIDESLIGMVCGSIGENVSNRQVTIATIQTLSNLSGEKFDLIILDEAHRAESESYKNFLYTQKNNDPTVLRFTATPFTTSGYIYGDDKDIKYLTYELSLNELIDEGVLCPIRFKQTEEEFDTSNISMVAGDFNIGQLEELAGDEKKLNAQVSDALERLSNRNKIVWACISIKHAQLISGILASRGEEVSIIHSELSLALRKFNQSKFEDTSCRHMVSVTIVSEGYDYPPIDAIVMMRPTRSPVLYVQLVGRGLRLPNDPDTKKKDCLILDYGGVVNALGHPNDPKIRKKFERINKATEDAIKITCPSCMEMYFEYVKVCTSCAYVFEKEKKEPFNFNSLTTYAWSPKDLEKTVDVLTWFFVDDYVAKSSGKRSIKVTYYYGNPLFPDNISEYFPHDGPGVYYTKKFMLETKGKEIMPTKILIKKEIGDRYYRVVKRIFH